MVTRAIATNNSLPDSLDEIAALKWAEFMPIWLQTRCGMPQPLLWLRLPPLWLHMTGTHSRVLVDELSDSGIGAAMGGALGASLGVALLA